MRLLNRKLLHEINSASVRTFHTRDTWSEFAPTIAILASRRNKKPAKLFFNSSPSCAGREIESRISRARTADQRPVFDEIEGRVMRKIARVLRWISTLACVVGSLNGCGTMGGGMRSLLAPGFPASEVFALSPAI